MEPGKPSRKTFSVGRLFRSFRYAFSGIAKGISGEPNMRIHILAAIVVIVAGFLAKLSSGEWIALVFAIGFVLAVELFNSAIESLADFISPEHHPKIGRIKDISAGAVLLATVAAIVTGIIIFWPHFRNFIRQ